MGLDAAQNVNFVIRRGEAVEQFAMRFQSFNSNPIAHGALRDKTKQDLLVHLSFSSSSAPSIQTLDGTLYCKAKATGEGREMPLLLIISCVRTAQNLIQ